MRIPNAVSQIRKFDSRIISLSTLNNGQSSNWRHDWFKFSKKSYCDVVKSVFKNKCDQVDNYPWNSRVLYGDGVNTSQVTNRDTAGNKARAVNTKQRLKCDPNGHKDGRAGDLANVKRKGVTLQNKASSDRKTKVRSNTVATHYPVFSKNSAENHDKCSLQNNLFTHLVHNNRFWPLIDLSPNQEGKVVIDEVQGDRVLHEGKKVKEAFYQSNSHTDTVESDIGQSDTVGGDSRHASMLKALNTGVDDRQFPVSTATADKYDLALRFKTKYIKKKIEQAESSEIFKLWDKQTVGKFDYIPLTSQVVGEIQQLSQVNPDLLQVHETVKQTGTHNFLSAQIPIPSQLNVEAWEINLTNYWDKQLMQFIRYVFL